MDVPSRPTGLRILGGVPWGTHFCQFYRTRRDLLDILVPYFKAGLKNNEACMWICAEPLDVDAAKRALRKAVPDLAARLRKGQIEILPHTEWYLRGGRFGTKRVLKGWTDKLDGALARGFDGLRLSGNTFWLEKKDWARFTDYEAEIDRTIGRFRMIALCTYSLDKCGAEEIVDVLNNHKQTLIRRAGKWTLVESSGRKKVEADLRATERAVQRLREEAVERQRAERALDQRNRILDAYFVSILSPLVILDRKFNFIRVNKAYAESCGRAAEDFPGHNHFEFFPNAENEAIFRNVVRHRTPFQVKAKPFSFPGHPEWGVTYWDWTLDPILDDRGAVEFLVFALNDVTEETRAREEMRRSESLLRTALTERLEEEKKVREQSALLELAHDAIVVRDIDDRIVFWNRGAEVTYGWPKEEALGRVIHDFLGTRFLGLRERIIGQVIRDGHWEGELVHVRKDGRTIVVESRWALREGREGKPAAILEINRDITKRKDAEEAMRQVSAYTRGLIEASLDPLVTISPAGKITDVNKATELATGIPRAELIGSDFSDYFTEPAKAREGYQEVFMKGSVRDYPLALRHVSGKVTDVLYNAAVYWDQSGEAVGVFAAARDITARKVAEEERLRLAMAVEQITDGISILDLEGRVLSANPAFADHHGLRQPDVIGRPLPEILQAEAGDGRFYDKVRETLEAGKSWTRHFTRKLPQGGVRELDLEITPIREASGRLVNAIAIERDVTQEAIFQDRIRQWQKMEALGTLAGGIAHDFNNLLLPILINTELTLDEKPEDEQLVRRLSQILEAARRGKDMVKQIIAFSRQKEQERRPVEVSPLIRESLEFLKVSMPKNIRIVEKIQAGTAMAIADPTQIHQILVNLGANAAHAMREKGGVLEIGLAEVRLDDEAAARHIDLKPGPYIRLTVKDDGHGMTPEVASRVFEPFFTTKKTGEGTGMGLAVVHGIVKSHRGAISLRTEPQKGTEFTVLLPRIVGARQAAEKGDGPYPKGSESILFVDDEDIQVRAMSRLLEHLGYRVVGLTDSRAALEAFRREPGAFDLAIMDQTMPDLSGADLARELLSLRPDLPIILCTGYSESINEENALALGIKSFMLKPFSARDIAVAIRRVLPGMP